MNFYGNIYIFKASIKTVFKLLAHTMMFLITGDWPGCSAITLRNMQKSTGLSNKFIKDYCSAHHDHECYYNLKGEILHIDSGKTEASTKSSHIPECLFTQRNMKSKTNSRMSIAVYNRTSSLKDKMAEVKQKHTFSQLYSHILK